MEGTIRLVLVNFASPGYVQLQDRQSTSARSVGGAQHVQSHSPSSLPSDFVRKNLRVLLLRRGAGYWLWKPKIILDVLQSEPDGANVLYCDVDFRFVASALPLFQVMRDERVDVMTFDSAHPEVNYTKKRVFEAFTTSAREAKDINQRMSGCIALVNSPASRAFVSRWLAACEQHDFLIDDRIPVGERETFIEHRHDQSLLSLLAKQERLPAFRSPARDASEDDDAATQSRYPRILEHQAMPRRSKVAALAHYAETVTRYLLRAR